MAGLLFKSVTPYAFAAMTTKCVGGLRHRLRCSYELDALRCLLPARQKQTRTTEPVDEASLKFVYDKTNQREKLVGLHQRWWVFINIGWSAS